MTSRFRLALATAVVVAGAAVALAAGPKVGGPAPGFSLTDSSGTPVKLSDHKGKYVVLEWVNPDCPFVKRHYDSGNMPSVQKNAGTDVAWLVISSTNASHREYRDGANLDAWLKARGAAHTAMLMDPDGTVGRLYEAKTTPHMFVIDPQGALIYAGAIDDNRRDSKGARNYVQMALAESRAGKPVSTPVTSAYGCTIKY
jgi:hypothetical protein